jgi:hypothetical protein
MAELLAPVNVTARSAVRWVLPRWSSPTKLHVLYNERSE